MKAPAISTWRRLPRGGSIRTSGSASPNGSRSRPDAAGDIAAARALASGAAPGYLSETAVARACALVGGGAASRPGSVIAFRARAGRRPVLASITQWGSLAAAMVVAGWLGFTLGMDASGMMRVGPAGVG